MNWVGDGNFFELVMRRVWLVWMGFRCCIRLPWKTMYVTISLSSSICAFGWLSTSLQHGDPFITVTNTSLLTLYYSKKLLMSYIWRNAYGILYLTTMNLILCGCSSPRPHNPFVERTSNNNVHLKRSVI